MSPTGFLRKRIQSSNIRTNEPLNRSWLKHSVLEAVEATQVNNTFAVTDVLKYLKDEYHQDPRRVFPLVKDILREIETADKIRRLSDNEPCVICGGIPRTIDRTANVRKVPKRSTRRKMGSIGAGKRRTSGKKKLDRSSRNKSRANRKVSEQRETGIVIADDTEASREEDRIPQESNPEQSQME